MKRHLLLSLGLIVSLLFLSACAKSAVAQNPHEDEVAEAHSDIAGEHKPPWSIYVLIQGKNWFGANAMVIILAVVFLPLIVLPYVVDLLRLPPKRKGLFGEIAFYLGTFLLILVSYIAAAGKIQAHIF